MTEGSTQTPPPASSRTACTNRETDSDFKKIPDAPPLMALAAVSRFARPARVRKAPA